MGLCGGVFERRVAPPRSPAPPAPSSPPVHQKGVRVRCVGGDEVGGEVACGCGVVVWPSNMAARVYRVALRYCWSEIGFIRPIYSQGPPPSNPEDRERACAMAFISTPGNSVKTARRTAPAPPPEHEPRDGAWSVGVGVSSPTPNDHSEWRQASSL